MPPTATRAAALRWARGRLAAAGIAEAEADARLLLQHAAKLTALDLVVGGDERLGEAAQAAYAAALERRLAGEPVGRILQQRSFWGLPFNLSADTLEPRDDSEALIEEALALLGARAAEPLSVLDLGTGTGCLLIALIAACRQARGLGLDISAGALAVAASNAALNGVAERCRWLQGSWSQAGWTAGLGGPFDIVVSNPPYIRHADIDTLQREVREHDPLRALDGGADGLDAYRAIIPALPALLAAGGKAVLEVGAGQEGDVRALAMAAGFNGISARRDLGGHVRAIGLWKAQDEGSNSV